MRGDKAGCQKGRQGLGGTLINPRAVFVENHGHEVLHLGTEPRTVARVTTPLLISAPVRFRMCPVYVLLYIIDNRTDAK